MDPRQTNIEYRLPEACERAELQIWSVTGQVVKSISLEKEGNLLQVSSDNLPAGIYSCQLIVDGKPISHEKMVILK